VGSTPIHSRLAGARENFIGKKRANMSLPSLPETEILNALVGRFMVVEDITTGDQRQGVLMRFRGRLINPDTAAAYDQMVEVLRPFNVRPLFRWDGDRHAVLLVPAWRKPSPANIKINLILFVLTLLSVLFAGALNSAPADSFDNGVTLTTILLFLWQGWPFAVSLLGILLTHEFGHYLMGRYHGTPVSLPYFIPFPLPPLGTMGAFINMKEPPKNKRVLLDIAFAGPFAGLVVAILVLLLGLSLSKVGLIEGTPASGQMMEGNSLLYLLIKYITFGQWLPHPVSYGGLQPLLYWIRYVFTGQPFPLGGIDVMLHPVAFAGWAGILVTSLNLVPAGQLDGGHMLYVLLGAKGARRVMWFILAAAVLLGFFWNGWWFWAFLILFLGRTYAEPLDQITPLDGRRKALALLALLIFVLVFTPVPLI
jgi:membrane-associated protease RseP (regulator of RpoE activity)